MNETARALHLDHTIYKNVSGVEQAGHLTTARDMATLTKEAMKLPFIQETVGTQSLTVQDVDGRFTHTLASTNILLGKIQGIQGVKTGWTDDAGQCLITQTTRNQHTIITVVLNSQDRFGETEQLIEWSFRNHQWKSYLFEDWLKGATAGTYP
jgi:D-alanyl-D-alanine carboxypeptidase